MAVRVNPPPHLRIPQRFLTDKQTAEYFRQLETILFQLRNRTGGDEDFYDELLALINANTIAIEINKAAIQINADNIEENTGDIEENAQDILELKNTQHSNLLPRVQFLQQQIDGLPVFTCDTTGFTADSTHITADKVVA